MSAREKLTVCDVTNLPYYGYKLTIHFHINGYFVTSLTAKFSHADITKGYYIYTNLLCRPDD